MGTGGLRRQQQSLLSREPARPGFHARRSSVSRAGARALSWKAYAGLCTHRRVTSLWDSLLVCKTWGVTAVTNAPNGTRS